MDLPGGSMQMDYDVLASQYARHRQIHPGVFRDLYETNALTPDSTILEVGCGTGNYIIAIYKATGCRCWGIDTSDEMIAGARGKFSEVIFQPGSAEKLDFPDATFDFIFSVDVIHHLGKHRCYFQEAYRTLKPGGVFCTVTESDGLLRTRVPLTSYFPETLESELKRYPRISRLKALMRAVGFGEMSERVVTFPYEIDNLKIFEEKAFSALHLISEGAFKVGIENMHADLEKGPIQAFSHYLLLWGKKKNSM
jgi:ubiquinone/menaquinone biosynthesis C-methylase UbiE